MKRLLYILIVMAVSLYGCGNDSEEIHEHETEGHETEEIHEHEGHSHEGAITFTEEQQGKVDFATTQCVIKPFGQVIKTTAQVIPATNNEHQVVARTSGVIAFQDNTIVEGTEVSRGQVLFYIAGGDMLDNNVNIQYVQAENEYLRAKAEYERKLALSGDKIVSHSELLTAKTEYNNAEAVYNNLKKGFSGGRQSVTAPVSGYVKHVEVTNGMHVDTGTPIVSIVAHNSLFIRAELPQRYAHQLVGIKTANFRVQNSGKTYTLEELGGKLVSYGKSIDMEHPMLPVTFEINSNRDFLPGSFVEAFITTQTIENAIIVPNDAIVEEMGAYFVFVMLHEDMFSKVAITKGVTDGLSTAVTSGLTGEETIVSRGAIFVKLAQGTGTLDAHAGHVH